MNSLMHGNVNGSINACKYAYIQARMHCTLHMHTYIYIHIYIYIYTYIYIYLFMCACNNHGHTNNYMHSRKHVYTYKHTRPQHIQREQHASHSCIHRTQQCIYVIIAYIHASLHAYHTCIHTNMRPCMHKPTTCTTYIDTSHSNTHTHAYIAYITCTHGTKRTPH